MIIPLVSPWPLPPALIYLEPFITLYSYSQGRYNIFYFRRGAGVAEQGRLLSDCTDKNRYRGFESHPLRHLSFSVS